MPDSLTTQVEEFMKSDNWETPMSAWRSVLRGVPRSLKLWDPFYCQGRSKIYLEDLGFKVCEQVRCCDETTAGTCDCMNRYPCDYDMMVTNPPFSILKSVFSWAAELNKPCLILVPVNFLVSEDFDPYAHKCIYKSPERINFISNGVQVPFCPFDCTWVGMNNNFLRSQIQSDTHRQPSRKRKAEDLEELQTVPV